MSENNIDNNWLFVSETKGIEEEDIIRFDHNDKTFCVYMLDWSINLRLLLIYV